MTRRGTMPAARLSASAPSERISHVVQGVFVVLLTFGVIDDAGNRVRLDPRVGVRLAVRVDVSLQPDPETDPPTRLTAQVTAAVTATWLSRERPCIASGLSPRAVNGTAVTGDR
jgi:hypothetical protein